LPGGHARHRRVVVDAGVVDHHLHRAAFQQRGDACGAGALVNHVEGDGLRAAAGLDDLLHHPFGTVDAAVGVDDHLETACRQRGADRPAQVAAAASHQRAALGFGSCS